MKPILEQENPDEYFDQNLKMKRRDFCLEFFLPVFCLRVAIHKVAGQSCPSFSYTETALNVSEFHCISMATFYFKAVNPCFAFFQKLILT